MTKKEPKKPYTLTLSPSTMAEVERLSKKMGLNNKSQMAENLLQIALDDAHIFEKAGLLDLVLVGRNIVQKFKSKILKGDVSVDKDGELKLRGE